MKRGFQTDASEMALSSKTGFKVRQLRVTSITDLTLFSYKMVE